MKTKANNINSRSSSRSRVSKESIWFYSEDSILESTPAPEKKSQQNNRSGALIKNDNKAVIPSDSERKFFNTECTFVVDWQMSELI